MAVWNNSLMDIVYYDKTEACEQDPCEVRIEGNEIVVSYDDDVPVVFKGHLNGPGHFELACAEVNGKATLHMFEGSKILEGFWLEGGEKGFWRITLR